MKDDILKELFAAYRPELGSSEVFMQQLQKKLAEMEAVKQIRARQEKRNRRIFRITAAVALATSCALLSTGGWQLPSPQIFSAEGHLLLPDLLRSHLNLLLISGISIWTSLCIFQLASFTLDIKSKARYT